MRRILSYTMPDRNVISWTSMIDGYCNTGDVASARFLFDSMPDKKYSILEHNDWWLLSE